MLYPGAHVTLSLDAEFVSKLQHYKCLYCIYILTSFKCDSLQLDLVCW